MEPWVGVGASRWQERTAVMTRRAIFAGFAAGTPVACLMAQGQRRDEIRERTGRLMGTIVERRDGVREMRDRQWRLLGTYHPRSNETRDRVGRLLTKGDSLAALLWGAGSGKSGGAR